MMRKRSSAILFSLLLLCCSASTFAQREIRLNATPVEFQRFYAKFAKAMKSGDKQAVAALSQFPFSFGLDAGDEGSWTRSQFLKQFDDRWKRSPAFLTRKNPIFHFDNGTYSISDPDDASHFIFSRKGRTYKFVSYMVEP